MHEEPTMYELTLMTEQADRDADRAARADERYLSDQVITESLNTAYGALHVARKSVFDAAEFETLRTQALDDVERSLLLSGTINGKNEAIRSAQMFNRTEVERTLLNEARSRRRRAELNLQLATDEVQRLRTLVALIISQN